MRGYRIGFALAGAGVVIFVAAWLSGVFAPPAGEAPAGEAPAPVSRGLSFVGPLKSDTPGQSAGLFIGVNEFAKDDGIATLNFAVNDAIELAHLFVLELKLIPPKECSLCLGGSPSGDVAEKHLRELEGA